MTTSKRRLTDFRLSSMTWGKEDRIELLQILIDKLPGTVKNFGLVYMENWFDNEESLLMI